MGSENKKPADVVLIQAPAWGRMSPPFALAILSSVLEKEGLNVLCLDVNNGLYHQVSKEYQSKWAQEEYMFWGTQSLVREMINKNKEYIDSVVDQVIDSKAKIVGFTVYFTALSFTKELAERIRERNKDIKIIFGGPNWTFLKMDLIKNMLNGGFCDAISIGEGEETIIDLVKKIKETGEIGDCPGVIYKENDEIINCGQRDLIEDVNALPFPDFSHFDLDSYESPYRLEVFGSRGCVKKCLFCSERKQWKKYRYLKGERLFAEIEYQIKKNPQINEIIFNDSCFNGAPKEIEKFCDKVIESDLVFGWGGQGILHPLLTKERLIKMKKSGCKYIAYGLETASQKILDNMNKFQKVERCHEIIKDTHEAGISSFVNFMFGFPTETEEDAKASRQFLIDNAEYIDGVSPSQAFFIIEKESDLYSRLDDFGINATHHLYWEAEGNTYPIRFKRYEEFCRQALLLGVKGGGVMAMRPDKQLLIGDYYRYKKDFSKAKEYFKRSVSWESKNSDILNKLSKCYENLEKKDFYDECMQEIKIFETVEKSLVGIKLAIKLFNEKKYKQALDIFLNSSLEEEVKISEGSINFYIGECFFCISDYSNALSFLNKIESNSVVYSEDKIFLNKGICYLNLNKLDEAKSFLKKAGENNEDNMLAQYYLGICFHREGNNTKAFQLLEDLFRRDPTSLDITKAVVVVGYKIKKMDKIKECVKIHLKLKPENAKVLVALLTELKTVSVNL